MPDVIPRLTLGEWFPLWLTSYKRNVVKQNTYHQFELLYKRIPESLTAMPMDAILPLHIQQFINDFSQSASKSYIDKMRVMLNALFVDAIDNGICQRNPTHRIRYPKVPEQSRESYTADEVTTILRYCLNFPGDRTATAIMLLLTTGMRRGELLGLYWSDLTPGALRIRRGVFLENNRPRVIEGLVKTSDSLRVVPLMPEVEHWLHALPRRGEVIFCTKSGGLMHPRNFSRDYDRFFDRLTLEEPSVRHLSPHCCRHTFATLSLTSGAGIRVVQQILGHTDIKTTARYTHPDMDTMKDAVEVLHDRLGG